MSKLGSRVHDERNVGTDWELFATFGRRSGELSISRP